MNRLLIVAAACVAMGIFVALHKAGGAVLVGICVGTPLFLNGVSKGGGISQMRITQDPGQPRRAADPNGSIGMGLAAAGIASAAMVDGDYPPPFRLFYTVCFGLGMLIALAVAAKNLRQSRLARTGDGDKPTL